ncbi:MAG TPA: hypothetical protein VKA34_00595 [Balneolales bacterium]|nr:hypothetical protein [Balneolales bacterium]
MQNRSFAQSLRFRSRSGFDIEQNSWFCKAFFNKNVYYQNNIKVIRMIKDKG